MLLVISYLYLKISEVDVGRAKSFFPFNLWSVVVSEFYMIIQFRYFLLLFSLFHQLTWMAVVGCWLHSF